VSTQESIVVARRFRGPESSGNGGYTCGRIAALVVGADTVEVTLRLPPPLDTPLRVERDRAVLRVLDGDRLVAEARPAALDLELPEPVSFAEAVRLAAARGDDPDHPFPGCFTCGPGRTEGDALRLRSAPAGDDRRIVAPWRPPPALAGVGPRPPELVWASLDCPGAYAVDPDGARGLSVLGRLTGHVRATPSAGDECVVVAWPLGGEGRRLIAGSALFRGAEPLAWARAVWVVVGDEARDPIPSAG
jgi:hypothetical protein